MWTGGVVVQHSPPSSSTEEVPLSKAPEAPGLHCGCPLLRERRGTPRVCVCAPVCVDKVTPLCVCVHQLPDGSRAERENKGYLNLT